MLMLKGKLRRRRTKREKLSGASHRLAEGMRVTFRAELMPGRGALERTFTVARVLANERIELVGLVGQHVIREFESV